MSGETIFDGYSCEICGKFHSGQYISVAFDSPEAYAQLKKRERTSTHLGSDDCVIGENEHYLRGIIELPIAGLDETFLWGAWARVWQRDYAEFCDHCDSEGRETNIGPYKGRLGNNLPGYQSPTLNLKCTVHVQPVGIRPLFIIEEPEHLLAVEQCNGISLMRARSLAACVYHKS
jgi:hypothetical protein